MDKKLSPKLSLNIATMNIEDGPIGLQLHGTFHVDGHPEFEKHFQVKSELGPDDVIRFKGFLMPILHALKDANGLVG